MYHYKTTLCYTLTAFRIYYKYTCMKQWMTISYNRIYCLDFHSDQTYKAYNIVTEDTVSYV
jgi:hypothetical protein